MVSFFIELKKSERTLLDSISKFVFFISAGLFFLQSLRSDLLAKSYEYINGTWVFRANSGSVWYWLYLGYLILTFSYSLYTIIRWSFKVTTIKERNQSQIIILTLILFFAGIFISNYILPVVEDISVPGMMHILSFIWITGFGYAIVKYKFMVLNPQLAANAIISKMNELLFFVDNNGKVIRINTFTEKALGFKLDEVMNQPFNELLIDINNTSETVAELKEEDLKRFKNQEYYLRKKTGEVIPFNLSSAEVRDDSGDVLGTIVVGYDVRYQKLLENEIDLRKQAEEMLKESEKKTKKLYSMVRLMCDNVPDMIWAKDLNSRYIFVNKATREKLLNSKDTEEPIGKTEQYFYNREKDNHPNNKKWFTFGDISTDSDAITIRNREPGRYIEFGNIRNKFVYLDVHKAPFWDEYGNLIGVVGCSRDIKEY